MNKCPKIGDRVRFVGHEVVGPCTGTVEKIYQTHYYDEDELDAALDGDDDMAIRRARRELKPQSEWHVALKVDAKPEPWCYGESTSFAPEVKDLEKIK
jgi:hypothetical protein